MKKDLCMLIGGAIAGGVVPKLLASKGAHKVYVNVVAAGLRAKSGYLDIVEEAKAQVDDIVAEARYVNAEAAPAEPEPATQK